MASFTKVKSLVVFLFVLYQFVPNTLYMKYLPSMFASAEETESPPSDVITLTKETFDAFLAEPEVSIIEFYAPWCGHCKTFAPEYELLATELKGEIRVAKVDEDEQKIGSKFGVSGFPTIILHKNGEGITYKGSRTKEAIIEEARKMADPEWAPPVSPVAELTTENFDSYMSENDFVLVMFHAPWCGHCKKIKPAYEEAAGTLEMMAESGEIDKNNQIVPKLARIDATEHSEIGSRYEVTGYPTLKIFRKGNPSDYKGGREAQDIIETVMKESGPASKKFDTVNHAKKMTTITRGNNAKSVLIGCFSASDESETDETNSFASFQKLANGFREDWVEVFHTFDAATKSSLKCEDGDMFLMHDVNFRSKSEPEKIPVKTSEDISNNKRPLVGAVLKETRNLLYTHDKIQVFIIGSIDYSYKYQKAAQLIRNKILPVAVKNQDKYVFATMNEEDFADDLKTFGLEDSSEDLYVVVVDGKKIYTVELEDGLSQSILEGIISDFEDGALMRHIKSAKAPKKNNGPVKVVVANNFDKMVMNKKQDVFIEFYAPWCGHCKTLEPIWKKLGKNRAGEKDLTIAKFDGTANDVPTEGFETSGFPTLFYVNKNNKIEKFEGDRDLVSFYKFLDERRGKDEL